MADGFVPHDALDERRDGGESADEDAGASEVQDGGCARPRDANLNDAMAVVERIKAAMAIEGSAPALSRMSAHPSKRAIPNA
jgi:hypothetical protein